MSSRLAGTYTSEGGRLAPALPQDLMVLILSIYPFRAPSVDLDMVSTLLPEDGACLLTMPAIAQRMRFKNNSLMLFENRMKSKKVNG